MEARLPQRVHDLTVTLARGAIRGRIPRRPVELPLAEVIYDLHDKLKSATRGYGTMDYEFVGYQPADLVRLDILVNGKRVDALSVICDRRDADRRVRGLARAGHPGAAPHRSDPAHHRVGGPSAWDG